MTYGCLKIKKKLNKPKMIVDDCETSDGEVKEAMDREGMNDSSESESESSSSRESTSGKLYQNQTELNASFV